eukprot:20183-Chlamydomonas_euryale.AAC.4
MRDRKVGQPPAQLLDQAHRILPTIKQVCGVRSKFGIHVHHGVGRPHARIEMRRPWPHSDQSAKQASPESSKPRIKQAPNQTSPESNKPRIKHFTHRLIDVTRSCPRVAASHAPFFRLKNALCASDPPYCSASMSPMRSYMPMSTSAMLPSGFSCVVAVELGLSCEEGVGWRGGGGGGVDCGIVVGKSGLRGGEVELRGGC